MFIVALLLVVFRALLAPLLTLAPAVLVTQLAGPVIGEAGKAGLPVSPLTQDLMLILTIGAGTDYGLFLVFRVREELRAGRAPHEAVTRALARVGESITFSAATVIAALLTMLLATFGLYSSVGAPLAIALALMLLADLTLLPALLAIVGRAAFWPSRTARGTGRPGWWGRTAGRVVAHPAATLAFGLIAFGALATAVLGYRPADWAPRPPPAARIPPRATRCSPPISPPPPAIRPRWCCGSARRPGTTRHQSPRRSDGSPRCPSSTAWPARSTPSPPAS